MTDRISFRVTGDRELARSLDGLADDLGKPQTMDSIADEAVAALRSASPRRSGRLASSWRAETTDGRAAATSTVRYAGPINYGWPRRNIAPARITEAADRALIPRAPRELEDAINTHIKKRGLS